MCLQYTGHHVGDPGPGAPEADSRTPFKLGVGYGHEDAGTLVPDEDRLNLGGIVEGVVERRGVARKAEDVPDALSPQCFDDNIPASLLSHSERRNYIVKG